MGISRKTRGDRTGVKVSVEGKPATFLFIYSLHRLISTSLLIIKIIPYAI